MAAFWISEFLILLILACTAWCLGCLVETYGIRVNYTRKILRLLLLVIPLTLFQWLPYSPTWTTCSYKGLLLIAMFVAVSGPVRNRISLARTCFYAIDRPEDRPHTILLLTTQAAACFLVIILTARWLQLYNAERLMLIGILVDGLGDALAEPIGIAFGKHRYRVKSLFSRNTQYRTLEGSACVFASAVLAILFVNDVFSTAGLALALLTIPLLVSAAEAWSPHTWDGPFLYLTSAFGCICVLEISKLIR